MVNDCGEGKNSDLLGGNVVAGRPHVNLLVHIKAGDDEEYLVVKRLLLLVVLVMVVMVMLIMMMIKREKVPLAPWRPPKASAQAER